ncbi:MAG: helix-turn-helix transcriptional regulator, partial [Polyangiales bacterium]
MRVPPPVSQIMTYDPEANEAMQKPNALAASASDASDRDRAAKPKANKKSGNKPNNVRKIRIERMMSKAELARRANLSVLTIDRVEKGFGCRMDTKRKILEALGLRLADRVRVFG